MCYSAWHRPACAALLVALAASLSSAADKDADQLWPQFLGPRRDNVSRETGLNVAWQQKAPKVLWKVPLGKGHSSCAVAGDRLYTLAERDNRQWAVCLDARTGKEVWARDLAPAYLDVRRFTPGPRTTPTLEKDRLYCLLPLGELYCLRADDGKEVWKTNAWEATGAENRAADPYFWGLSGSPLLEGDLVIVQPGGGKDNSVAAFKKDTGKLAWAAGSDKPGYGSPIVLTAADRRQVVCTTAQSILSVDPSNGKVLWRYAWGNPYNCNCATPLWADGLLLVSSAYDTGCVALEIVPDGGGLKVKEKWRNRSLQNQFATSVILNGHVYGTHGTHAGHNLRCLELATGKVKWQEREPGKSVLVAADGHLFCLNEGGTLRVVEANPEKYVAKGQLDDLLRASAWAAPVLLDKKLYLRDEKHLLCLDLAKCTENGPRSRKWSSFPPFLAPTLRPFLIATRSESSFLVPTLCVGTPVLDALRPGFGDVRPVAVRCLGRGASRPPVPTRSVGTRNMSGNEE